MSARQGEVVAADGTAELHAAGAGEGGLVPLGVGPWRCKRIVLHDDGDELTVQFERDASSDWIEVDVFPRAARRRAFRRLSHCAVAYRGALGDASDAGRREVAALVVSVATAVDERLAAAPGASLAEALGRRRGKRVLVFGRETLRSLLAPEIVEGVAVAGGWCLADVYPASHLHEAADDELRLVLDFHRGADGRRMLFEVGRRRDQRRALVQTHNLILTHLSLGAATPVGGDQLAALLSFVLQLRDHSDLELRFPAAAGDVARLLPAPDSDSGASERVLNLAINAGCEQACSFCSVLDLVPPSDGGDTTFARLLADLESNRARGVTSVRINGYDPLAYSRILDVLRSARELGYVHADVFSPCTRLSERRFCEEVVASLPSGRRFFIPLYGRDAAVHDAVVGTPGAFDRLCAALGNLRDLLDPSEITLLGVATRGALDALASVARWARELGLEYSAHMPYPSSGSRADRFFESVPRQRDVAEVVARSFAADSSVHVNGVAPCVLLPAMERHGVALDRWLDLDAGAAPLPGTEYRQSRFVHRAKEAGHSAFEAAAVPCPHVEACALSAACPRELLRAYVEAYGTGEIAPVSVGALVAAARARGPA